MVAALASKVPAGRRAALALGWWGPVPGAGGRAPWGGMDTLSIDEALGRAVDSAEAGAEAAPPDSLLVAGEGDPGQAGEALARILLGRHVRAGLEALVVTGAAAVVLPELPALRLEMRPGWRHKDVYAHTLAVVDNAVAGERDGPDLVLRMAALLHDVAKPATRAFGEGGEVSFRGHDALGAAMARIRLVELGFDEAFVEAVARLVALHLRTFGYEPGLWSDSGVRRYMADAGEELARLNQLVRADVTSANAAKVARLGAGMDDLEARIAEVARADAEAAVRPALDGTAVMALLGIGPGPVVGVVLARLLEAERAGRHLGPAEAEAAVLSLGAELGLGPLGGVGGADTVGP